LFQVFQSDLDFKNPIAIMIAIKKQFQINQTLIFIFQSNPARKFSSRL